MPTVPTARITSDVRQRAAPVVFQDASAATIEAFGGGSRTEALKSLGRSIGRTGQEAERTSNLIQDQDNEREAKRLDAEFSARIRQITYGDGETEGYFSSRGENAIRGFGAAHKAIEDARRELIGSNQNPAVQRMFGDASQARVDRELGAMSRHVTKQRQIASDAVSEARLNEAADDASTSWNDDKVIGQSAAIVRSEVHDMADRNGWPPEVRASKLQEAETIMYRRAVESALLHDPAAAKALYDKHKTKIDGRVRGDIEKALEAGTLRQQSQEKADEILSKGLDEKAALAQARKIKNAKLRDETVDRVARRYAENDRADREARQEAKAQAWEAVIGGRSVDDLDPRVLASMDGTAITAMRSFEKKRAKDGVGYADATDPAADNELHNLFMEDKDAFAKLDLTPYIDRLEEKDYESWRARQRAVDSRAEAEARKAVSYTLGDRVAKEYLNAAGIDYGASASKGNAEKSQKVFSLVRDVVDQLAEEGKRATRDDIEIRLKELFLTGEVTGGAFFGLVDPDKTLFEVIGTPDQDRFQLDDIAEQKQRISEVTGVPSQHIDAIVQSLRKENIPVTPANISAVYERAASGR